MGLGKTDRIPGGHEMSKIDELDERLHAALLGSGLLVHGLGDLVGALLDTDNKSVAVRALGGALIVVLHDDSLLAGISSTEEHNNLSCLQTVRAVSERNVRKASREARKSAKR